MATGTKHGLLEELRPAQEYLEKHFGLDASTALKVVKEALLRLLRDGPEKVRRPRRSLFNACRIRALQILRHRRRREEACAVAETRRREAERKDHAPLIALEDEDKPKFFGHSAIESKEGLSVVLERDGTSDLTATLETSESTVRMRVRLERKRVGGAA